MSFESEIEHLERIVAKRRKRIAELEKGQTIRDLRQQAKGVKEALLKVKRIGGGFLHECLFEDYIHDLQTQVDKLEQGE